MMEDGVKEDVKKLNSEARKESEEEESRGNSSGVRQCCIKVVYHISLILVHWRWRLKSNGGGVCAVSPD